MQCDRKKKVPRSKFLELRPPRHLLVYSQALYTDHREVKQLAVSALGHTETVAKRLA